MAFKVERCELTDLLVSQCGCPKHRNSDAVAKFAEVIFDGPTIDAVYNGRCALDESHEIEPGDRITHTSAGWVCAVCVRESIKLNLQVSGG